MCGIAGVLFTGSKERTHAQVKQINLYLLQLLLKNEIRGKDSTGLAKIGQRGQKILKNTTEPSEFVFSENVHRFINCRPGDYNILMAHNRSSTHGSITEENAHPYLIENHVGMHNGVVFGDMIKTAPESFEVDSQKLIWCIAKYGMEEVAKNVEGGAAVAVVNMERPNIVSFLKKGNPLTFCFDPETEVLYFHSMKFPLDELPICKSSMLYSPDDNVYFDIDITQKFDFETSIKEIEFESKTNFSRGSFRRGKTIGDITNFHGKTVYSPLVKGSDKELFEPSLFCGDGVTLKEHQNVQIINSEDQKLKIYKYSFEERPKLISSGENELVVVSSITDEKENDSKITPDGSIVIFKAKLINRETSAKLKTQVSKSDIGSIASINPNYDPDIDLIKEINISSRRMILNSKNSFKCEFCGLNYDVGNYLHEVNMNEDKTGSDYYNCCDACIHIKLEILNKVQV